MFTSELARHPGVTAEDHLRGRFAAAHFTGGLSAQFVTVRGRRVAAGVSGLPFPSPVISLILQSESLIEFFAELFAAGQSILFTVSGDDLSAFASDGGNESSVKLSPSVRIAILECLSFASTWGGSLNENGELTVDLRSPAPGPHYYTNFLIGNRIGFDRPLQSTPKSVVDRLGRGSFRSHADTQVLATRWDYLPEENGFPANRQFYLLENGRQIFYSGAASQDGVTRAHCRHSQNRTVIEYELESGLVVRRTIFVLPQEEGLPIASEAQLIEIENLSGVTRNLRIVCTGMFGTSEVHALREDVIFTTVVAQSNVFYREEGDIAAISFNPNPKWTKGNIRFSSQLVHTDGLVLYPDQYCARYSDFVGSGTLEHPENLSYLSDRHSRKGPGFFALSTPFSIRSGAAASVNQFVSLSSDILNPDFRDEVTVQSEIKELITRFSDPKALPAVLSRVEAFTKMYASYLQIRHDDPNFQAYVNENLPFQVFYQTFVSRSFDWTQKGYREIGFREIQDIYASMYYFAGMGQTEFVKKLLREWAGNVAEDGYANHNFYWTGKEPGWWSDDSLWLLQALDRYVSLTGDYEFLRESLPVAGTDAQKRPLFETIRAIITYSFRISVGRHGLPLIDRADWNDCLRVDPDCLSGPDKIARYRSQLDASGKSYGQVPFESEYSESVMNGFLLKVAVDAAVGIFAHLGDEIYEDELKAISRTLRRVLQKSAWKSDFFARVLFNRSDKPQLSYLGAAGDGLAIEEGATGAYFLNSFSWSVLADCADESQIDTMLDSLDRYLRTPYGFRLCTGVDYPQIAPKIDVALYYAGDRENGGIFKHANMMAAAAMLQAAKSVKSEALSERLTRTAYWVIDCILPYRTLKSPYEICGNPRLCTQYNNSETGENIGPTLSGTSTWLLLCLFAGFGIEFTSEALLLEPILRPEDTSEDITVNTGKASYHIVAEKPAGFRRYGAGSSITCDGVPVSDRRVPIFEDGRQHEVRVILG